MRQLLTYSKAKGAIKKSGYQRPNLLVLGQFDAKCFHLGLPDFNRMC